MNFWDFIMWMNFLKVVLVFVLRSILLPSVIFCTECGLTWKASFYNWLPLSLRKPIGSTYSFRVGRNRSISSLLTLLVLLLQKLTLGWLDYHSPAASMLLCPYGLAALPLLLHLTCRWYHFLGLLKSGCPIVLMMLIPFIFLDNLLPAFSSFWEREGTYIHWFTPPKPTIARTMPGQIL